MQQQQQQMVQQQAQPDPAAEKIGLIKMSGLVEDETMTL